MVVFQGLWSHIGGVWDNPQSQAPTPNVRSVHVS